MNNKSISLNNIVWKEGKYYVSQCLNFGISSFGKSKKEALSNLKEAIELYLENNSKPKFTRINNLEVVKSKFTNA